MNADERGSGVISADRGWTASQGSTARNHIEGGGFFRPNPSMAEIFQRHPPPQPSMAAIGQSNQLTPKTIIKPPGPGPRSTRSVLITPYPRSSAFKKTFAEPALTQPVSYRYRCMNTTGTSRTMTEGDRPTSTRTKTTSSPAVRSRSVAPKPGSQTNRPSTPVHSPPPPGTTDAPPRPSAAGKSAPAPDPAQSPNP
jgi:hypothetical protein